MSRAAASAPTPVTAARRSDLMSAPAENTLLTSATPAARSTAATSDASRIVRYAGHTTRMTVTNVMFMVFTIAMPVGMYLLFSMMFGDQSGGQVRGMIMVNMAAYGGLGAAVTAGTQIQEDQRNGFLRQLIVAGLSPRSFLAGSVMAASAVIIPALVAVGIVGLATGVEASPGAFLATLAVLWVGLLPTILIGIVLGMVLKGGAAMAGGVITMMAMAIFGGLWMPLEMFPSWMQTVGHAIPTYWISSLGEWALYGGPLSVTGLLVIGAWTLALALICTVSMSRAVGLTRR
ncbi:ABC transporter permease [Brachybacterium fresconis]|uniref:ABC-2 type transport system permease protein n=1 Tax=Brachybacterium fresconis TaxID=173363 RepID=A0ABS4YNS0_9MICO|nr:ABC transporter permease [Brachybacterium fresconis]MBP2410404.1 ABC-2 type transport system permease protein [Brachybacterium fresconis]